MSKFLWVHACVCVGGCVHVGVWAVCRCSCRCVGGRGVPGPPVTSCKFRSFVVCRLRMAFWAKAWLCSLRMYHVLSPYAASVPPSPPPHLACSSPAGPWLAPGSWLAGPWRHAGRHAGRGAQHGAPRPQPAAGGGGAKRLPRACTRWRWRDGAQGLQVRGRPGARGGAALNSLFLKWKCIPRGETVAGVLVGMVARRRDGGRDQHAHARMS